MTDSRLIASITAKWEKIASSNSLLSSIYAYPYREVVAREVSLASVKDTDYVVNIGCGAVPFTAIHVARISGAQVWAMEREPDTAQAARQCIQRLGLEQSITIIEGDAAEGVPEGFTAAFVALQAEPKNEILNRLVQTGKADARLVFRAASSLFEGQYDDLDHQLHSSGCVHHNMATFDRSLLYLLGENIQVDAGRGDENGCE